jgi:hypothetical protein
MGMPRQGPSWERRTKARGRYREEAMELAGKAAAGKAADGVDGVVEASRPGCCSCSSAGRRGWAGSQVVRNWPWCESAWHRP